MLAIPVLWERLAGDLICPELIDERLHQVLKAQQDNAPLPNVEGLPADLAAAMALTRYLRSFPAAERSVKFDEINKNGIYDYVNWLLELIEQRGPEYPDQASKLADVMSDCCMP